MNLMVAVIEDLYTFAGDRLFRQRTAHSRMLIDNSLRDYEEIDTRIADDLYESDEVDGTSRDEIINLPGEISSYWTTTPQKNTVMYVASTETPLRSEPSILRDTNVGTIPYGAMVMVLDAKNGWARVMRGTEEGWVESRDLADRAADILPQFVRGAENNTDDPTTIRLRAIIRDEFSCGAAGLPLQSHEYVFFKLIRKDIAFSWPRTRPRNPGKWAEILAGVPGVVCSVEPKSGAVMEYFTEEGIGRLAYVEAVFPDDSIQISEANWPENGIYNERVLSREEWDALHATFITFS